MKKVLVTGGAGFIGSNLVYRLLQSGYEVVVVDQEQMDYGVPLRLAHCWHDIDYVRADVRSLNVVTRAARGCEAIFHLAAISHVPVCERNPALAWRVNTGATAAVLEAARLGGQMVLFAGTDHVYASQASPLVEGLPFQTEPDSVYSATKIAGIQLCQMYSERFNVDARILVSSNVFGAGQDGGKVVPLFIKAAIKGDPLVVHGGSQVMDQYHVDNLVNAYIHILKLPVTAPKMYHVGSGHRTSVRELAEDVIRLCNSTSRVHSSVFRFDVTPDKCWVMDTSRLRSTGWVLTVPYHEGLRRTIALEMADAARGVCH